MWGKLWRKLFLYLTGPTKVKGKERVSSKWKLCTFKRFLYHFDWLDSFASSFLLTKLLFQFLFFMNRKKNFSSTSVKSYNPAWQLKIPPRSLISIPIALTTMNTTFPKQKFSWPDILDACNASCHLICVLLNYCWNINFHLMCKWQTELIHYVLLSLAKIFSELLYS